MRNWGSCRVAPLGGVHCKRRSCSPREMVVVLVVAVATTTLREVIVVEVEVEDEYADIIIVVVAIVHDHDWLSSCRCDALQRRRRSRCLGPQRFDVAATSTALAAACRRGRQKRRRKRTFLFFSSIVSEIGEKWGARWAWREAFPSPPQKCAYSGISGKLKNSKKKYRIGRGLSTTTVSRIHDNMECYWYLSYVFIYFISQKT
jgi:hypothetical protein